MTGVEAGGPERVCGVDRGADIWVWEDVLVGLRSISEVHLVELRRWGIWK